MSFFKSLFNRNSEKEQNNENDSKNHLPYTLIPKEYNEDLAMVFADKFTANKCKFFYCENNQELIENLEKIFLFEKIKILFCKDENLFDILTHFDVGFTEFQNENPDAIILTSEYLEACTGKIFVSKENKELNELDQKTDKIIIIANENQLIEKFINLYNDYYSIQNQNKFTTFSIFKKEIILLFLENQQKIQNE